MKKILSLFLALTLLVLCACQHDEPWHAVYEQVGTTLVGQTEFTVGSVGGEWAVLGLSRAGLLDEATALAYRRTVQAHVAAIGTAQLHHAKSTENSRIILGLTAAGGDVRNVGGVDLLEGLTDMDFVCYQGLNGPIWALIAFDCGGYDIPAGNVSREGLVEYILNAQLPDGGWAFSGSTADVDMTAMALQALAPYRADSEAVRMAVERALEWLCAVQLDNGSYASWGSENAESCAQVIVALSALGIDAGQDSRFSKNGNNVLDALCSFAVDSGFTHTMELNAYNAMATEQGFYALCAYARFRDGQTALYDMRDISA